MHDSPSHFATFRQSVKEQRGTERNPEKHPTTAENWPELCNILCVRRKKEKRHDTRNDLHTDATDSRTHEKRGHLGHLHGCCCCCCSRLPARMGRSLDELLRGLLMSLPYFRASEDPPFNTSLCPACKEWVKGKPHRHWAKAHADLPQDWDVPELRNVSLEKYMGGK